MIRKDTKPQGIIGKPFMQRTFHGRKCNLIPPVFKDGTNTVSLFHAVATDVQRISLLHIFFETLSHHIKVLAEDRLCRRIKSNRSIRCTCRFITKFHTTEIQCTECKLASVNQLAI